MLRAIFIAAIAAAAVSVSAAAQEQPAPEPAVDVDTLTRDIHRNGFVVSEDACGASAYDHLVGEPFAELHVAALPANAGVWDFSTLRTLEFTPDRLNVVLGADGRIVAIGCF
jgi:hypothetical protein